MELWMWALLLLATGMALALGELLLPTGGVLGILSVGCFIGLIVVSFMIHSLLGVVVLALLLVAVPVAWSAFVKVWPKTPVGRRVVLPEIPRVERPPPPVQLGQTGRTISELRPIGVCEFNGERVETVSEHGIIPPGQPVKVVGLAGHRPVVRREKTPMETEAQA